MLLRSHPVIPLCQPPTLAHLLQCHGTKTLRRRPGYLRTRDYGIVDDPRDSYSCLYCGPSSPVSQPRHASPEPAPVLSLPIASPCNCCHSGSTPLCRALHVWLTPPPCPCLPPACPCLPLPAIPSLPAV